MHCEGTQPGEVNVGPGNEFHIEGFCDRNSVIAGYVYVYGNVDPGERYDPLQPAINLSAWIHRDDRLGHAAPPRTGFLDSLAQSGFAAVSYEVGGAGGEDCSLYRRRPQILWAGHTTHRPNGCLSRSAPIPLPKSDIGRGGTRTAGHWMSCDLRLCGRGGRI